ncbi:MAG: excinuclease ABC subunit UvrC [Oscillospiraceae bacterium]|nr:excinuclease ABC subunit UvrC [Oscillospiraceae bacterium]
MHIDQLKDKARSLPYHPGVYLMKDAKDQVIYVGKAKRLKSRVSQYFQDTASHTPKTRHLVSHIDHFDVIIAASEFEALVLECSLIKKYQPKYNILLKDDKGYPYIRLDPREEYPSICLASSIVNDSAEYYGPFGSRSITNELIESIKDILKLPHCSLKFPKDIGKNRPCLHFHMNQCAGWCRTADLREEYQEAINQARMLLRGDYKKLASHIREQMLSAAENLNFEIAAAFRDRLDAIERLSQKQLVATDSFTDVDVIGYGQTETHACFAVLHFCGGNLLDKEYEVFSVPDDPAAAVSALMKQYYLSRGAVPKIIFLPFEIEDSALFEEYVIQNFGIKSRFKVPQRGDNRKMLELANKNASEEAQRITDKEQSAKVVLSKLAGMLGLESVKRIESFDISNISGTDIVASMVVFQDGKPHKAAYKRFKIDDLPGQDDYASMHQVITRRFSRMLQEDAGFLDPPDLLLIDGGINHANVALAALDALNLHFPVFGMVKDDRHKTRALVTPDGREIRIDNQQSIFSLIGRIQEETHRFAITYHKKLRSKRLRYSTLDKIPGIGEKRKELLLKTFGSISSIQLASLSELERILPKDAAYAVFDYFNREEG